CETPSEVALDAAMRVARAFESEVESLFIENAQLYQLASYSFAREISLSGRQTRSLSEASISQQLKLAAHAVQRRIEALARIAEVPFSHRIVRDEPVPALARACSERGPWNVVALAEPFSPANAQELRHLFEEVTGTTGLVIVGPSARRTTGPVVAVVEDLDHVEPMLRAAERLATITTAVGRAMAEPVTLVVVGEDRSARDWLEGQVRLMIARRDDVRLSLPEETRGVADVIAEEIRRLGAGFVVSQFGGHVVPAGGDLRHLAIALECPLFLMR
ncbi:MAG TPA: hypothetical protein PK264_08105, partial [Hyphomicrobiaceae bacterium]|nr:hypothetical protein [Hyphomicrobiaceae bacterium]